MSDAVFEIRTPDGALYQLFATGEIRGFPPGSWVFNRYPEMVNQEISRALSWPTKSVTASEAGEAGK